jgi:hypothetical protein
MQMHNFVEKISEISYAATMELAIEIVIWIMAMTLIESCNILIAQQLFYETIRI